MLNLKTSLNSKPEMLLQADLFRPNETPTSTQRTQSLQHPPSETPKIPEALQTKSCRKLEALNPKILSEAERNPIAEAQNRPLAVKAH